MTAPPPLPSAPRPDWWSRNWPWAVPLICLAGLVLFGGIFTGILGSMKSSDAYTGALARASSSPPVMAALGTPIHDGFLVTGSINVTGASGEAELAIPIKGQKRNGTIYVVATRRLGEWRFDRLIVAVDETGERIDVLKSESPAAAVQPDK